MTSAPTRLVPYSDADFGRYVRFGETWWGRGRYQTTRSYVDWIRSSPLGRRPNDFLLAECEGEVVGCVINLRLAWRTGEGELAEIPTAHNWMVAEEHRQGVGMMLLTASYAEDRHSFIPIASGELSDLYRKLRFQEVPAAWFRKVHRPVRGGLRYALHAVRPGRRTRPPVRPGRSYGDVTLVPEPSEDLQLALFERWSRSPRRGVAPEWTWETFRWRFFHPSGPRTSALHAGSADDPRSFALLSVGQHRGVRIGRVIDATADDPADLAHIVGGAGRALRDLGAHVSSAYSMDARLDGALVALGWRRREASNAFVYHASRRERFGDFAAGAAGADQGFETIVDQDGR